MSWQVWTGNLAAFLRGTSLHCVTCEELVETGFVERPEPNVARVVCGRCRGVVVTVRFQDDEEAVDA